jgi:hypothetical protein
MDTPSSRRAAIGRALNAREPVSTDAFLALTEEERSRGITLFSDEQGTPAEQHDTFERGPAPVAPIVPSARMFRHPLPSEPPGVPIMTAWQARVLGTMLTAAAMGFFVALAPMMRTPADTRLTVPSARPPASTAAVPAVPITAVAATSHDAIAPAEVATVALVPDETPEKTPQPAPSPAPARTTVLTAPRPAPQPQRLDPPVRRAVLPTPIVAEPLPMAEPALAPSPVAVSPAPPPRVEAVAAPVRVVAPEAAIQTVLGRYRAAYQELDAAAARAVWPSADTKALRKAFDRLEAQELVFDSCAVSVSDARAVAVCSGTASYVPRVGKRARRGDQRQWEFELSKANDGWLIDTVSAR